MKVFTFTEIYLPFLEINFRHHTTIDRVKILLSSVLIVGPVILFIYYTIAYIFQNSTNLIEMTSGLRQLTAILGAIGSWISIGAGANTMKRLQVKLQEIVDEGTL